jgi:hypothetical protein
MHVQPNGTLSTTEGRDGFWTDQSCEASSNLTCYGRGLREIQSDTENMIMGIDEDRIDAG